MSVAIEITRIKNKDAWQVTYKLSSPVDALQFDRSCGGVCNFRRKNWKVAENDLAIKKVDKKEILYSQNQKPIKTFTLDFKSDYKKRRRDYELHKRFTDGSLMMYTGHLFVNPIKYIDKDGKKMLPNKLEHSVQVPSTKITMIANETIILDGKVFHDRIATWEGKDSEGIYFYVGNIEPLKNTDLIAIIDPGSPKWIRTKLLKFIPDLFKFYKNKLGISLPYRPIIFFNYKHPLSKPSKRKGLSYGGSVLSQLVTFHVLADHRWEKDNSETTGMLFTLLAHEIHHLWNAKIVNYENETIWLHEGGAAFFEDHTLLSLGLISKEKYRTIRSQELNNCILGLDGISLKNSRKMRRFQNYYRCGSMINLLVEEALKQVPNYNIYSFWGDLIQKGLKTKNRTYTEKMYLQLLQEKTQNPILVTNINKLLNEQITNRTESFQQFFTAVGLRTQVKKEGYSNSYQREIGKMAITNLMQLDCGYQSIYWNKDHIVFDIKSKCNNFKTNTPIARIGGYDVYSGGVPLYDYLHTTCKQKGKIELELKDSSRSTMSFQCDYVFPSRNLPLII